MHIDVCVIVMLYFELKIQQQSRKIVCRSGCAGPAGVTYSAPHILLAGLWGRWGEGKEEKEKRGMGGDRGKGKGVEGRGRLSP